MESAHAATAPPSIPTVPGLPLLGNFLQMPPAKMHLVLESWAREFGPIFRFRMLNRDALCISRLDDVLDVLKHRPDEFRRLHTVETVLRELGIHGLFSAEGDDWRRMTRLMRGAFARKSIGAAFAVIPTVAERVLEAWAGKDESSFDARGELMRFTADVTSLLVFGYDVDTVRKGDELQHQIELIFEAAARRITFPVPYWRLLRLPRDRAADRAVERVRALIMQVVAEAGSPDDGATDRSSTLLDAMLEARRDESFSDDDVFGNVFTLLLAGEDTTANTMAWMVYYVATRPDVHAAIRAEADAVLGDAPTARSLDQLHDLHYTEWVFKEALRMRSVAPQIFLEANVETAAAGVPIAPGELLVGLTRFAAMSEEHFSEPDRFMPERWDSSVDRGPAWRHNTRAMLAFGAGPRTCPGAQLAQIESKVLLSALCKHFDFELTVPEDAVQEISTFVVHPNAVPVRVRPREG